MLRNAMMGAVIVGLSASAAQANFFGTVDFDDGTVGPLTKVINVSNPQSFVIADFGGPGLSFNHHGTDPAGISGGFKSSYRLADTTGTGDGDVYGDIMLQALYRPSNEFEIVLAARVQDNGSGFGLQASNGLGGVRIGYQNNTGGTSGKGTTATAWSNSDPILMDTAKWYDISFSAIGSTATGTVTELDGSFLPVPGHSVTVIYVDTLSEMAATGFAGTRGAQPNNSAGYVLDNVTFVPEPGSMLLLGFGAVGLMRRRRTV